MKPVSRIRLFRWEWNIQVGHNQWVSGYAFTRTGARSARKRYLTTLKQGDNL